MQKEFKFSNKRLVLKCIAEKKAINRAGIAKLLNLSKPTVSDLVKQLLDEEFIFETGSGESLAIGGRKPVQLAFNPKRYYIVGVDIGGTNVVMGLLNLDGEVSAYREFSTQEYLSKSLFPKIKESVDSMIEEIGLSEDKILGLGVGVPGITNIEDGIVIDSPALKWKNFPIKAELKSFFNYPIYVDNDVNSIVLGEHWKGAAKDKSNIIYIAIGTGIGSGIILNGNLYRGSHYSAGEMGYLVTSREDYQKFKPIHKGYGHLESIASGSSIAYQLSKKLNKTVSSKEAFELYQEGNEHALEVIDFAIDNLAIGIASSISLFDPELIIIGGGVSQSFPIMREQLMNSINQYTPNSCVVIQSTLGESAGVIGAAALFLKEHDSLLKT